MNTAEASYGKMAHPALTGNSSGMGRKYVKKIKESKAIKASSTDKITETPATKGIDTITDTRTIASSCSICQAADAHGRFCRHHQYLQIFAQLLTIKTESLISPYWGNLGVCLMMQFRYDEAEKALTQALAIDPDYPSARDNLTLVLQQLRHMLEDLDMHIKASLPGTSITIG